MTSVITLYIQIWEVAKLGPTIFIIIRVVFQNRRGFTSMTEDAYKVCGGKLGHTQRKKPPEEC